MFNPLKQSRCYYSLSTMRKALVQYHSIKLSSHRMLLIFPLSNSHFILEGGEKGEDTSLLREFGQLRNQRKQSTQQTTLTSDTNCKFRWFPKPPFLFNNLLEGFTIVLKSAKGRSALGEVRKYHKCTFHCLLLVELEMLLYWHQCVTIQMDCCQLGKLSPALCSEFY